MTQTRLEFVIDLDGVVVAQTAKHSMDAFIDPRNKELPEPFQDYHANNVVIVEHDGKLFYYLLLPNVVDMFGYLFIDLADIANISIFSGGPEKRNSELMEVLKQKVAAKRNVSPDQIKYRLFSSQHCRELSYFDPLQPSCENSPHIPQNSDLWNPFMTINKKILSLIFGRDLSNVIIVDNCYGVMTVNETDHHLKAPTFDSFSGSDFFDYRDVNFSQAQQHISNTLFIQNHSQFYRVNLASLIVGTIDIIIRFFQSDCIPPVTTLTKIQVCQKTKKYSAAIEEYPMYEKYRADLIYNGFLILQKINPLINLFAPYTSLILEDLYLFCKKQYNSHPESEQKNETNGVLNIRVSSDTSQYDNTLSQTAALQKQITNNNEENLTQNKLIDLQIEEKRSLIEQSPKQSRRHSIISWEAAMKKSHHETIGVFSQNSQKQQDVTINTTEKLLPNNNNQALNSQKQDPQAQEPARCCTYL